MPASPSPSVVPTPYSNPAHVDPEEAFVAAISSCHMLTFLYLAGRQGFQIDSYDDDAVGVMTKNECVGQLRNPQSQSRLQRREAADRCG